MTGIVVAESDPFDVRRARRARGLLREFNEIGLLAASDVHVADRIGTLDGERDARGVRQTDAWLIGADTLAYTRPMKPKRGRRNRPN